MNIEKMSLTDLKTVLAKVEAQMPITAARERQAARAEIEKALAAKGLKLTDILGQSGSARRSTKGRTVPVKFRDPKSGAEWSGRGRRPKWFDPKRSDEFRTGTA